MAKDYPRIAIPPPGPRARAIIERDARVMSQNYKKDYPLVMERGYGPVVEDADGNRYLDFAATSLAALSIKAATDFGCDT